MRLRDFMDLKMLQEIQDRFSNATGLAAIAVDAEGNYITEGSNFTEFCMKYTRGCQEGLRRCVKCDNECKGTYYCHAGLMDFATDIIVEGERVGAIIGGQVLPGEPEEEKFIKIAQELGIDPKRYVEAVKKVPVRKERQIYAAAELIGDIVNRVVNLEYIKHKDNRRLTTFNEEIGNTTETVRAINEKTKELEKIASRQNILALNASIEAARAGEAGVGFAVVAGQMGELSKKSGIIYKEITEAAEKIQDSVYKMNEIDIASQN